MVLCQKSTMVINFRRILLLLDLFNILLGHERCDIIVYMCKPNINNALFYPFSDNKMHVFIEITQINSFKPVAVVEEYCNSPDVSHFKEMGNIRNNIVLYTLQPAYGTASSSAECSAIGIDS